MPTWPASLPQTVMTAGLEERPPDTSLRSQMDAGPAKVRRRFTAGVRVFSATVPLSDTETETLDSFYQTDLQGGALRFDWTHPRTGAAVKFRFVTPPRYAPRSSKLWLVQLQLEILP